MNPQELKSWIRKGFDEAAQGYGLPSENGSIFLDAQVIVS